MCESSEAPRWCLFRLLSTSTAARVNFAVAALTEAVKAAKAVEGLQEGARAGAAPERKPRQREGQRAFRRPSRN